MTERETDSTEQGGVRREPGRVVAISGALSWLGQALIRELELDPSVERIIALDLEKPAFPLTKTVFKKADLTLPGVDADIAKVLRAERVDTVVHLAFLSNFVHQSAWAHEFESIGTMNLLNACSASPVQKIVQWSKSWVYGARPGNPAYLHEDHELYSAEGPGDHFFADKVDAERQVQTFAAEHPSRVVTILRMAPAVMPAGTNFMSRFLRSRLAPVVIGFDPLLQLLHPQDAQRALYEVVMRDHPGAFNIASDGVLPYRTVLGMLGRIPFPVAGPLARRVSQLLWMGQVVDVPPSFLDFLRYPCVMDIERARQQLRFHPAHDIHQVLAELAGKADDSQEAA